MKLGGELDGASWGRTSPVADRLGKVGTVAEIVSWLEEREGEGERLWRSRLVPAVGVVGSLASIEVGIPEGNSRLGIKFTKSYRSS